MANRRAAPPANPAPRTDIADGPMLRRAASMGDVVEHAKTLVVAAHTAHDSVTALENLIDRAGKALFGWKLPKPEDKTGVATVGLPEGVVEQVQARLGEAATGFHGADARLTHQTQRLQHLFEQLGMSLGDDPKQVG